MVKLRIPISINCFFRFLRIENLEEKNILTLFRDDKNFLKNYYSMELFRNFKINFKNLDYIPMNYSKIENDKLIFYGIKKKY